MTRNVKKGKAGSTTAKKAKINQMDTLSQDQLAIANIIIKSQHSDTNAKKCCADLTKIYAKIDHEHFMNIFLKVAMTAMHCDDHDQKAERLLKFIAHFVASFGEEISKTGGSHPVIVTTFAHILGITSLVVSVRVKLCKMVTSIMALFSQKSEIDEDILDKITKRMLFSSKDSSPLVRAEALCALQRLQDPENSEDPVTKAYIYHMESDPAPKVRQSVITAIAKKFPVFPAILERLQDVDEKVRHHTYIQIASFPVKTHKIVDRMAILQAGLFDRSELVKKVIVNMLLPNWIAAYENNYVSFVYAIKLDSKDEVMQKFRKLSQKALSEIFKKRKLSELIEYLEMPEDNEFKSCLPIDRTSVEWLLVWKMIIQCHRDYADGKRKDLIDNGEDDDLDHDNEKDETLVNMELLPELSIFCDYILKFLSEAKYEGDKYKKLNFNYCILTLLEIAELYDFGDEMGRNKLQDVLRRILIEHPVSEHVIKQISVLMEQLVTDVERRLEIFNNIVVEMVKSGVPSEYSRKAVLEDLINKSDKETQLQANSIKLDMMKLKEQESVFVERKQYADAHNVAESYTKLNDELVKLLRPVCESINNESSQAMMRALSSIAISKKITTTDITKNLQICYFAITSKRVKSLSHDILKIYNEFVRYHLESQDIEIRVWSLKTATAYSMLYESLAKDVYVVLKSQMFKNNNATVWECTIGCIFDLLLRYTIEKMEISEETQDGSMSISSSIPSKRGTRTLYTNDDEAEELGFVKTVDVISMMLHVMENNADQKVYKTILIGFFKLILHGLYCTREIISKFLLAYFNPATDPEISQLLGVFFEDLIRRKRQELLHDALIPTMFTLLEAPYDSPLREVKLETILRYVIEATRPIFCSSGLNLHNSLACKFLAVMKENPDNKNILKIFSKELLVLEIGEDSLLKRDARATIEEFLQKTTLDHKATKNIIAFRDMLNGTYRAPLKFSSTANQPSLEEDDIDEDPIDVDNDDDETMDEKIIFHEDEIIDQSLSQIKMMNVVVNVARSELNNIQEESADTVDTSDNDSCEEIPASQAFEEIVATQDVPATHNSDDEIPETSFEEDTINETIIEASRVDGIPATPEIPITKFPVVTAKRNLDISRSNPVSPSVSSPIRKAPRNSPPISKHATTTPKTPALSRPADNESSASRSTRVTRANSKTPAGFALSESKASTPNTDGPQTRKQARSDKAQSSVKTRSSLSAINIQKETDEKLVISPIRVTTRSSAAAKETHTVPVQKAPVKSKRPVISKSATNQSTGKQAVTLKPTLSKSDEIKPVKTVTRSAAAQRPRWK